MIKKYMVFLIIFFQFMQGQNLLSTLKITLPANENHQFVFGNKIAGFWLGNTLPNHAEGFSGWTNYEYHYFSEISFALKEHLHNLSRIDSIALFPDHLERYWDNYQENFYFVDLFDVIIYEIKKNRNINDRYKKGIFNISLFSQIDTLEWFNGIILIKFKNTREEQPAYAAISLNSGMDSAGVKVDKRKMSLETNLTNDITLIIALGYNKEHAFRLLKDVLKNKHKYIHLRQFRIEKLLKDNAFRSKNSVLQKAYYWSLISMDDLISNQKGPGIFAGYPWFNNYWGRDTFISLEGALLATGKWNIAKKILLHFAKFQIKDSNSHYDGRIPNRIQLRDVIYNTADGTPWYFYALQRYIDYTGDSSIMDTLFDNLKYFINRTIERGTDSLGFIVHGDAETWMDAKGTAGPWSPRGNRAIEIQLLWLKNLESGIYWAEKRREIGLAQKWKKFYIKVRSNLNQYFTWKEKNILYDHLNNDGTSDTKIRPNMIFEPFLNDQLIIPTSVEKNLVNTVISQLTFPYGVATLPQEDEDFHPFHEYEPYYVKDEAYHNGLIWCWLNGPIKSVLARYGCWKRYFQLFRQELYQILHINGIGSLSELLEPIKRPGEKYPKFSGTVSQAWSLAEFIRSFHEDLVGVKPYYLHPDSIQILIKKLPSDFLPFEKIIKIQNSRIRILQIGNSEKQLIQITKSGENSFVGTIKIYLHSNVFYYPLIPGNLKNLQIFLDGDKIKILSPTQKMYFQKKKIDTCANFTMPDTTIRWKTIYGRIHYNLLKQSQIKQREHGKLKMEMKEKDAGERSHYLYPKHPAFEKGIADLQEVKIFEADSMYTFELQLKKLVNPGWRPESGFQLTLLAIAIAENTKEFSTYKKIEIPFNSRFSLQSKREFSKYIVVGNGIEIYDKEFQKIAAYIPPESQGEFGNIQSGKIIFSLPKSYFKGKVSHWKILVLCGLQDDHGGGGIGEFRTVKLKPSEWNGGGFKKQFGNVYDWLSNFEVLK